MPDDWTDTKDTPDVEKLKNSDSGSSKTLERAVQGPRPATGDTDEGNDPSESKQSGLESLCLEEIDGPPYDESQLEYRIKSPHADYQAYKALLEAQRWHELQEQAITCDSLPEAVVTTAATYKEARDSDETKMDEYFRLKYGTAPYTSAAYPQDEDEE